MTENKLADLSIDFAVGILKLTDNTKGHYSLINQLERSANGITSPYKQLAVSIRDSLNSTHLMR